VISAVPGTLTSLLALGVVCGPEIHSAPPYYSDKSNLLFYRDADAYEFFDRWLLGSK
jgi:hypothetical protein